MSMPTDEAPKLAGKCHDCGAAMTVRKSKRCKTYYSCSGYPDCKFMSWDVPTGERCAVCNEPMVKFGRNGVKCSGKTCPTNAEKETKSVKKGNKAPEFAGNFVAPPLEEPIYDDYMGYFPPDFEE